jgi:fibronectin-binding autotransporter adhesin
LNLTGPNNNYTGGTIVSGGTLRLINAAGTALIGSGVTVMVNNDATLELAGPVSSLSDGTAANSANISNNSTAAAGVHVTGTHQKVGNIDGAGTTQVDSGSDLTANHILQGALVLGGDATHPALVTIDASDASGHPLIASSASLFGAQSSLALGGGLAASRINSANMGGSSIGDLASAAGGNLSVGGSLSSVPEPSTLLLVLLGVLGVVVGYLRCDAGPGKRRERPRFFSPFARTGSG